MARAFTAEGSLTCEDMCGCRYSLTMHHSADELRAFGMTNDMIDDQEWYVGHGYLRKSMGHYYVSELVRGLLRTFSWFGNLQMLQVWSKFALTLSG